MHDAYNGACSVAMLCFPKPTANIAIAMHCPHRQATYLTDKGPNCLSRLTRPAMDAPDEVETFPGWSELSSGWETL